MRYSFVSFSPNAIALIHHVVIIAILNAVHQMTCYSV
jgi:hypothetical protein